MSPPTKDFARLSLEGDMPRRSQRASRRQTTAEREVAESSSEANTIEAASGLTYVVDGSNGKARTRAEVGLHNVDVKLRQAIEHDEDEEGVQYFAFEFTDQFSIRVGDPESTHSTPSCTCGANEDGIPCKHLYWFVDQVVRAEAPEGIISISEDLTTIKQSGLIELIHRLGFEDLVDKLPKVSDAAVSAADLPQPSGDLATIRSLRKEVSATLRAFDVWILYDDQAGEEALDVAACASRVEELVLSIIEACAKPQWEVTEEGIATLLELGNSILSRNRDAHKIAHAAWGLNEDAEPYVDLENNLYTRLLRHDPVNEGASVFAALNEIGHEVLFVYDTEIKSLLQQVLTLGLAPLHRAEVDRLSDRLSRSRKRGAESSDRGTSSRGRARR